MFVCSFHWAVCAVTWELQCDFFEISLPFRISCLYLHLYKSQFPLSQKFSSASALGRLLSGSLERGILKAAGSLISSLLVLFPDISIAPLLWIFALSILLLMHSFVQLLALTYLSHFLEQTFLVRPLLESCIELHFPSDMFHKRAEYPHLIYQRTAGRPLKNSSCSQETNTRGTAQLASPWMRLSWNQPFLVWCNHTEKESLLNSIAEQNSCIEPERNQANTRGCLSTVPENIQRQTILDNNRRLTEWPILQSTVC